MPDASTTGKRFDDLRVMWKAGVAMYLVGAATVLAILPVPDPDPSDHTELAIIGIVMFVLGLGFWAAGPRRNLLRITAIFGIVLVSVLCAVAKPVGGLRLGLSALWAVLAGFFKRLFGGGKKT